MQVTKLEKSGYMLEYPQFILVFDCVNGHDHVEKVLRENPDKAAIFFVTHNHRHTFDTAIFNMAQNHRRVYVLGNDIPTREIHDDMPIAWMSAGDRISDVADLGVDVEAVNVGDAGVGYYVSADGASVFYGGGLGEDTDAKRVEVLLQRFAVEHPSVALAMVAENVADTFAAKVSTTRLETYSR